MSGSPLCNHTFSWLPGRVAASESVEERDLSRFGAPLLCVQGTGKFTYMPLLAIHACIDYTVSCEAPGRDKHKGAGSDLYRELHTSKRGGPRPLRRPAPPPASGTRSCVAPRPCRYSPLKNGLSCHKNPRIDRPCFPSSFPTANQLAELYRPQKLDAEEHGNYSKN